MKIFEFVLLIFSVSSFLVYEKVPLNTYASKVRKELKAIMAFHFIEELHFDDFDYNEYNLSSVKTKAVFFNSYMPIFSANSENDLSLKCSWSAPDNPSYISPYHSIYTANIIYNNKSYPIEFQLESKEFTFIKTWELYEQDSFYVPKGSIEVSFVALKAKNLDENNPFSQETLISITNAFLAENEGNMNKVLNDGIDTYYKSLPFEELEQKIYVQTANIPKENNFDLTLEEMPELGETSENETFIIFKRKGKLNGEDIGNGSTFDDDTNIQRFNLHALIYQRLILDNIFNITFEQSNNPSSMYQLTGEYLKKVANITINDTVQLKVQACMEEIIFNTINPMIGDITFYINIISMDDSSVVFPFTLKMKFAFNPTLLQSGLNFYLISKDLTITDITPDPDYEITDATTLIQWIENTYLCALGKKEYNLLENSLDLSYYFNTNDLSCEFKDAYLSIKKN